MASIRKTAAVIFRRVTASPNCHVPSYYSLQIHRHSGYTRALPLERMMRDGRGYAVGGGTVEILRNTLAALEFGRSFDQRRG